MKINEHPMKPTEDQIREWARFDLGAGLTPEGLWHRIACAAYAAGADAELEACVAEVFWLGNRAMASTIRDVRRPKLPSLKERLSKAIVEGDESQALKLLEELDDSL